jgi:hypothetical protein
MVTALPAILWRTHGGKSTSTIIWIVGGLAILVSIIPALVFLGGITVLNQDKETSLTGANLRSASQAYDAITFLISLLVCVELVGWVFSRSGKTPSLGGLAIFLPLLAISVFGLALSQLIYDAVSYNNPDSITVGGLTVYLVFNNLFFILTAIFGIVVAEHSYTRNLANGEFAPDADLSTGYAPTAPAYPISHPHQPGWEQPNQPIYQHHQSPPPQQPMYAPAAQPGFSPPPANVHNPWPQQPPVQARQGGHELNKTEAPESSLYI